MTTPATTHGRPLEDPHTLDVIAKVVEIHNTSHSPFLDVIKAFPAHEAAGNIDAMRDREIAMAASSMIETTGQLPTSGPKLAELQRVAKGGNHLEEGRPPMWRRAEIAQQRKLSGVMTLLSRNDFVPRHHQPQPQPQPQPSTPAVAQTLHRRPAVTGSSMSC